jgi:plasmid stabilization system protein ParE
MRHPYLGREARAGWLRELVVGKYVLIYRITEIIEIVTVVHGARRKRRDA